MSTTNPKRMAEDEALGVQKFLLLRPGDFVCISVERNGQRLYGYGRVLTVNPRGVVQTYEGATGKTQTVREGIRLWALPSSKLKDPDGFMVAIKLRAGKPFESWDDALDFANTHCVPGLMERLD